MDDQQPKPARKWRTFLLEFGTIVLGVSVALAAQQAVDWWNWRGQVTEARALIATEMARNVRQGIFRSRTLLCGERRLDELAAILDNASRTGMLPPVGDIGLPPRGIWFSGNWESVVASQAATHFPREELAALNSVYKMVPKLDEFGSQEIIAWNALYAMVGPGRRLDPASEARLREALSQARAMNRGMTVVSGNLVRDVTNLNLPFSPSDLDVIAQGERQLPVKSRNDYSPLGEVCSPIDAVPAGYGQAMWKFVPAHIDENLKQRLKDLPKVSASAR